MTTMHRTAALGLAALLAGAAFAPAAMADDITTCDPAAFATKYPDLEGKTVIMGASPNTPPYAMINPDDPEQILGSDIELAQAVFDCMGVDFEVKPGAWPGLFPAVVSGQIDTMFYLYYNPTRAEQGDFIPYMTAGSGAIVAKGNPAGITSQDDLCGKTLTAGMGTVEEKQAQGWSEECVAAGKDAITVMTNTDAAAGFRLISSGRADGMVSDLPLLNMMVKNNPDKYEIAYEKLTDWQIGAVVANDNPLGAAIYEAMKIVQDNGTQAEIFAKYGIEPELMAPAEYLTE